MKDTMYPTPTTVFALLGALVAAACGGATEPEPSELPDLGVPEFAVVNDLELRARLEVTQANPSTRVRVSVSTTNRTRSTDRVLGGRLSSRAAGCVRKGGRRVDPIPIPATLRMPHDR